MRINTNVSALNALSNLNKVQDAVSSSMEKLSSGFRINRAGDDAAGLGIANQMGSDITAMTQASRNADQAGSVLQIMDGATSNVQTILERMKELAAQSASDTVDAPARTKINNEFVSLSSEIDRISATTKFQGASLLDGSFGSKTANAGTVNTAASGSLTGAADIGATGVAVTSAATFRALTSDITASVKVANVVGVSSDNAATVAITAGGQKTIDTLTTGNLTVTNAFKQTNYTAGTMAIGAGQTVTGVSGSVAALAAGTYTLKVSANGTTPANTDFQLQLNGVNVGSAVTNVVAGAAPAAVDGITFALKGGWTQANATALDGQSFTIAQVNTVTVTGGGAVAQSQDLVDDGSTAQTGTFSNFGISVAVPTGQAAYTAVNSSTIAITAGHAVQLSGKDAAGTTITDEVVLNSNPAGQVLDFGTKFGVSITLAAGTAESDLATQLGTAATSKIVQNTGKQAEFLVSSSQSYGSNDLINLDAIDLTSKTLGVNIANVDLTTAAGAQTAMTTIDSAIDKVGTAIGAVGAAENRIMYADNNVKTAIQNFTAAESAIKDVDMASEMTSFSKNQILAQAGTAMLAQANQLGQSVLKLLQ